MKNKPRDQVRLTRHSRAKAPRVQDLQKQRHNTNSEPGGCHNSLHLKTSTDEDMRGGHLLKTLKERGKKNTLIQRLWHSEI